MVRIGIVDDKTLNRKTVQRNLSVSGRLQIVLEADNGKSFLEKAAELAPDKLPQVVLMDIDMPVMNGIDAIAIGTIKYPQIRFLVLSVFDDDEKIFEAIQAGASGYLLKDDSAIALSEAIEEIISFNGAPMSPAVARKTLNWLKQLPSSPAGHTQPSTEILSEREIAILKLMVEGFGYKQIAEKLCISPLTVRTHTSKIYEKLHINSKAQAIQAAHKFGWA